MGRVDVTPAKPEHARSFAALLRPADLAECVAEGYADGETALEDALGGSDASWLVLFDGKPAAMYGVGPFRPARLGGAIVWVLTTPEVERAPMTFFRESKRILAELLERHAWLGNLVDANYHCAIRWLSALGFTIGLPAPHCDTGALFCPATIRRA